MTDKIKIANKSVGLKQYLLLLAIMFILFFLNGYQRTLFFRPGSIHQWRQADCLSITKNYFEENLNFFKPKIHYQGVKDGKAVSEFPILNYSVALLWTIFGEHEFIYRLLEYLIFICAVVITFGISYRYFQSYLLSYFLAGLLLTSPLIVYYSLNFIADVPAFSIGLISFFTFYHFYQAKKQVYFYLSLLMATLAVLMKASALTSLAVIFVFTLIDVLNLNSYFKTEKLFQKKLTPLLLLGGSLIVVSVWYTYALYYNDYMKNEVFLLTVLPIWELNSEELMHATKMLFNNYLLPWFLNKSMFTVFVFICVFVCYHFKLLSSFFKISFILSGIYFIMYFVFFYQVFNLHDYYLINLMIFPVITTLSAAQLIINEEVIRFNLNLTRFLIIVLLLGSSINSAAMYRLRTINKDNLVSWYPFISEDEINLSNYLFWEYGNAIQRIENITPDLRKHNIKRDDIVLSIPDPSFNISLYFMDQKGFTITRDHLINDSLVTDLFLNKNIKYVVLSDTSLKNERAFIRLSQHLQPYFTEGDVKVYKFLKTH